MDDNNVSENKLFKSSKFKARKRSSAEAHIAYVEAFHRFAERRRWAFREPS
jgi:hypothetical protein